VYDWLIVGAGFAGSGLAERLASERGNSVLVVDRRPHLGGNAFDQVDEAGILVHKYGPHIFHANSQQIFDYLSQSTEWRPYSHRVLAEVDGMQLPIPINRTTINTIYGLDLTSEELDAWLSQRADPVHFKTSKDVVVFGGLASALRKECPNLSWARQ
jgi:UDP-galactopyranose mutase